MSTQVTVIEPIKLPNPRRPAMLPSLPEWAARCSVAVKLEVQESRDGKKFEEALVLPAELIPNQEQRIAMLDHIASLRSYLAQTPDDDVEFETNIATSVSKILIILAGEKKSELAEEGRSEVYLDVLSDIPHWAVDEAVRRWFRHDCGSDERGRAHDYKWAPDPGTLRQIAYRIAYEMRARIGMLQRVVDARPFVDCSEQLADGRAALHGLKIGLGNLETASGLTFEEAIKLGKEQPDGDPPSPPLRRM